MAGDYCSGLGKPETYRTGIVFELLEADSVSTFIVLLSIAVGLAVGTALVLLLQLQRRSEVINSMPSFSNAVGQWGIVEVPLSATSRGKVRLTLKGSTMDLLATTDAARLLAVGERVFVVAAQGNSVLVVPEDQMQF
ncbi:MAG: NfeD-like protein [Acaryochloridaceae cyanobacterium RL_2_7]|nr:NfeD-like protein [Acaryochloridaceae cyanobacterium RL_2_7]